MSRIQLVDENHSRTNRGVRELLLLAGKSRGRILNVFRALANRPKALEALFSLAQAVYLTDSSLQAHHGELAYLTATAVNECFY